MAIEPIKYVATLRVRATSQMAISVQAAARARQIKTSDWLRDAVETILCLDGLSKYPKAPKEYPMTKDSDDGVKLKAFRDPISGAKTDAIGAKGTKSIDSQTTKEQRRESNPSR